MATSKHRRFSKINVRVQFIHSNIKVTIKKKSMEEFLSFHIYLYCSNSRDEPSGVRSIPQEKQQLA